MLFCGCARLSPCFQQPCLRERQACSAEIDVCLGGGKTSLRLRGAVSFPGSVKGFILFLRWVLVGGPSSCPKWKLRNILLFLLLEQIPLAWDALKPDPISAGTAGKPPLAEGTPVLPPCCSGAGMLSVAGMLSLVKRQGRELEIMTSSTTPAPRAVFIVYSPGFVCLLQLRRRSAAVCR